HRCLQVLRVGWKVCWAREEDEEAKNHVVFLSHDISLLHLFKTFLENAPQLTLLLYTILHTNRAEPSQGEGLGGVRLNPLGQTKSVVGPSRTLPCPAWGSPVWFSHISPPLALAHKVRGGGHPVPAPAAGLGWDWGTLCAPGDLQGTDLMESPGPEQLYRAMVAVILYFSWFNVAPGRTLPRSIIYHGFMLVDSALLALSWLWGRPPSEEHQYLIPVVAAALPCYLVGLLLRVTYYQWLHPNVRAQRDGGCDEVDANGTGDALQSCSLAVPELVNRRMRCLAQAHFSVSRPRLLNGAAAS
ncbi:XKR8 protein, partial [Crotophaga sulcirostris]|nr:XKR8 protein [Crotophaga sulcirostris]